MTIFELKKQIEMQLRNIMCFDIDCSPYMENSVARAMKSINASSNKYFVQMGTCPDPFNSLSYAIFLYYLSNEMYKVDGDGHNAEKVYYLNKALNMLEIFYANELPDIWGIEHPVGSVLGRAHYGNYFFFYQGCTVGGSFYENKIEYPFLGEYVTLFSNSKILGNCHIGNHVMIAANTYIVNCDIPDFSYVFPSTDGRNPIIVKADKDEMAIKEKQLWRNK